MKHKIISIVGYFDTDSTIPNGQTIKTINIAKQVAREFQDITINTLDYSCYRKKPLCVLIRFVRAIIDSQCIIMLPAQNAIKVLIPLSVFFSFFFKTKTFYIVIGAWLPNLIRDNRFLYFFLKRVSCIFTETTTLKEELISMGLSNTLLLPNFKILNSQKFSPIDRESSLIKLFYLSRVMPEKGVNEMIQIVRRINSSSIRCILDIYGPVHPSYYNWFKDLQSNFPSYINYRGVLDSANINETIIHYDLQLFPTKYKTEGIPGCVLDSFYAGVPVLASNWNSASDLINDFKDGVIFSFMDYDDMYQKLDLIISNKMLLKTLKLNCRSKCRDFSPHAALSNLINKINECYNDFLYN